MYLPVTRYNSHQTNQTKCNGCFVPATNVLSQIVTSYLGIQCTKHVVTRYILTRTFLDMIVTNV